jgi:ferredoxin-NADP reductase
MRTAKLVRARVLAPTVRELTLDPGPDFMFEPGQWVSIRIPAPTGEDVARSYSLASAPRDDGTFDLAVTRVERGPASNFLHALPVGSDMTISRAQGFFTMEVLDRPAIMVATGTGISPFRSMLQHLARGQQSLPHPVRLLLGVRTEADMLYADELRALAQAAPPFRFEVTLSRGSEGWAGKRGYVQQHVPGLVRELGADCAVYICGLSRMVKDVRKLLKTELGMSKDRIRSERYD